jgi:serine/threonine-protein kinase HipA
MFNYLIGNSDAHAKNISLMISTQGYHLAPFYDFLSVQTYGDNELALYIGDERTYGTVAAHSWEAWAEECVFGVKPTLALFRKMAQDISKAWSQIVGVALSQYQLSSLELAFVECMTAVIESNRNAASSMTGGFFLVNKVAKISLYM